MTRAQSVVILCGDEVTGLEHPMGGSMMQRTYLFLSVVLLLLLGVMEAAVGQNEPASEPSNLPSTSMTELTAAGRELVVVVDDSADCADSPEDPFEVTLCAYASGGTPPYSYQWSGPGGPYPDADCIDVTIPGTYCCTVLDFGGDEAMDCGAAYEYPRPILGITAEYHCWQSYITLCANPTGGTPPFHYEWTGPGSFYSNDMCIDVDIPGEYCCTVADMNDCRTSDCISVSVPPLGPFVDVGDEVVCGPEDLPVPICAYVTGGTPPYYYDWTGPGGSYPNVPCIDVDLPGEYCCTVTAYDGCQGEGCGVVIVNPPITALVEDVEACADDLPVELCCTAFGGTPPFTYEWTGPGGSYPESDCIMVDVPGEYCCIVTDTNNCHGEGCGVVIVFPPIAVDVTDVMTCEDDLPVEICCMADGGLPPYTYEWMGPGGSYPPMQCIMADLPGEYCCIVTDDSGCAGEDCGTLILIPPPVSPNLLSPPDGAPDQPIEGLLAWEDVAAATAYTVQLGIACGEGLEIEVAESWYAHSGLQYDTTYYWRVKASNECQVYGEYSECFSFTTEPSAQYGACCFHDGSCLFVTEEECGDYEFLPGEDCDPNPCTPGGVLEEETVLTEMISVTPNPSDGAVTVLYATGTSHDAYIDINDVCGRRIQRLRPPLGKGSLTWDATTALGDRVAPGIYFMTLRTVDKNVTCSLLLIR
jgi:hypothetical protein